MYLGRLEEIKGVHILIESFSLLKQNYPQIQTKLLIIGSGDDAYTENLKNLVRISGLYESIQFLSNLSKPEIRDYLAQAKFSVLPSLCYENLPNSILESYACATPVIGSGLGSIKDLIIEGQTGVVFKPGDKHDLAAKMLYLLDEPLKTAGMGVEARKFVEKYHNENQHVLKLEQLFETLVM